MSDGRVHPPGGEIIVYEDPDGSVRVEARLDQETVWLSLTQMSELFQRDKSVVSRHLGNVFRSGELEREAVVAKNATTAADGKTYQVEFFNLDAILSVGYRVNSKRGTQFRIWATHVLRDHLVRGYTLNERRLAERGLQEARDTLELLASTLASINGWAEGLRATDEQDEQLAALIGTHAEGLDGPAAAAVLAGILRGLARRPAERDSFMAAIGRALPHE